MFTEEQLAQIMDGAKEEIRTALIADIKEKMRETVSFKLRQELSAEIQEYVKTEIAPVIKEQLVDGKDSIIAAAVKTVGEAVDELAVAMTADLKKKFSDSWTRRQIMEALFK